jgi:PAS domain S-box-containing protein
MIPYIIYCTLWAVLVALDVLLARTLFLNYRKDGEVRKFMYAVGLLQCIQIYVLAIVGINASVLTRNIFALSPTGIIVAYLYALINERFNLDRDRYKPFYIPCFLAGLALTAALYFVPFTIDAEPFLIAGVIFAVILAVFQYAKRFDISAILLFLAIPYFTFFFLALQANLVELALVFGFSANVSIALAFEVAKRQTDANSPILVLKRQLSAAEANFSKIFSILPDPALIVDQNGVFLAISPNVTAVAGYEKEDLVGKSFVTSDLVTAYSKGLILKNLGKRMLGLHVAPYEIELRSKDGRMMQFEINASRIDYEGKPADMVVFRDLTERNKLIQSVEREQKRFQSVAENSGEWIWETNAEGKYIYSNQVAQKILGIKNEELLANNYLSLLSKESEKTEFSQTFFKRKQFSTIRHCLKKDGSISILETNAAPLYDGSGQFVGYRGVDRDVTERIRMEERLLKSERLASIGELANQLGHDLRNPLSAIKNGVYIFGKKGGHFSEEKKKEILACMGNAVEDANRIVSSLIEYSSELVVQPDRCKPKTLILNALSRVKVPSRIKIDNDVVDETKLILDIEMIENVFVKIINNAIEAISASGTIRIWSIKEDNAINVFISDSGSGIPQSVLPKIFSPLVTSKAKGMGMSLAMCKRIMEAHGGKISFQTAEGKGTTFSIVLPIKTATSELNKSLKTYADENSIVDLLPSTSLTP